MLWGSKLGPRSIPSLRQGGRSSHSAAQWSRPRPRPPRLQEAETASRHFDIPSPFWSRIYIWRNFSGSRLSLLTDNVTGCRVQLVKTDTTRTPNPRIVAPNSSMSQICHILSSWSGCAAVRANFIRFLYLASGRCPLETLPSPPSTSVSGVEIMEWRPVPDINSHKQHGMISDLIWTIFMDYCANIELLYLLNLHLIKVCLSSDGMRR